MQVPYLALPTDAALVSGTRRGERHAYQALTARHDEAVRLAVALMGDPPELVRATFAAAHGCLLRETSSSEAVRPFVLQVAHHLHHAPAPEGDLVRADACTSLPFREPATDRHERLVREVAWLPPAWQTVLWHRLVERDDDTLVAAMLGVPAAKLPWLLDGALDLLRRNLLARHDAGSPPQCRGYALRLQRAGAGRVPRAVLRHAQTCPSCSALLDDLAAVDTDLASVLAEGLLGEIGHRYLVARVAATAGSAGTAGTAGTAGATLSG